MVQNRVSISEVLNGMFDWIWRSPEPLYKFLRTLFLINYPLTALFIGSVFPEFILATIFGPFLLLPMQLVTACCLNSLYLTQDPDYKSLSDVFDRMTYRKAKWEAQTSDILHRVMSAALTSIPLLLFFTIAVGIVEPHN